MIKKNLAILLTVVLSFVSCFKHEQKTKQSVEDVKPIKKFYCDHIDDSIYQHRCDKLTFKSLLNAFCGNHPVDDHEVSPGEWRRDTEQCYFGEGDERNESRSQCSGDGYIGLAHGWISEGASAIHQATDTHNYLESKEWRCGEGFEGYTKVRHLRWLLTTTMDHLRASRSNLSSVTEDHDGLITELHRYLVSLHAYAFARMRKKLSHATINILKNNVKTDPESMIMQALYNRFVDGDQQAALDLIKRDCPSNEIPTIVNYRGWGSSPLAVHCVIAISILEGM